MDRVHALSRLHFYFHSFLWSFVGLRRSFWPATPGSIGNFVVWMHLGDHFVFDNICWHYDNGGKYLYFMCCGRVYDVMSGC